MASLDELRLIVPAMFRGNFAFYPILLLLLTIFTQFAIGFLRGIRTYILGTKMKESDSESNDPIRILVVIQVICLISISLSVFTYKYPAMTPGRIGWELGFGFFFAAIAAVILVGPLLFLILDRVACWIGQIPSFIYGLTHGRNFEPGEMIVQTVHKQSPTPGPRAKEVYPARSGNYVDYVVDKFRRVVAVDSNWITLMTRRHKIIQLKPDDPTLRKPGLLERIRYRDKFPSKAIAG